MKSDATETALQAHQTLQVNCRICGKAMILDRGFAGGVCRCSDCGTLMKVPERLFENAQGSSMGDSGPVRDRPAAPAASTPTTGAGIPSPRRPQPTPQPGRSSSSVSLADLSGADAGGSSEWVGDLLELAEAKPTQPLSTPVQPVQTDAVPVRWFALVAIAAGVLAVVCLILVVLTLVSASGGQAPPPRSRIVDTLPPPAKPASTPSPAASSAPNPSPAAAPAAVHSSNATPTPSAAPAASATVVNPPTPSSSAQSNPFTMPQANVLGLTLKPGHTVVLIDAIDLSIPWLEAANAAVAAGLSRPQADATVSVLFIHHGQVQTLPRQPQAPGPQMRTAVLTVSQGLTPKGGTGFWKGIDTALAVQPKLAELIFITSRSNWTSVHEATFLRLQAAGGGKPVCLSAVHLDAQSADLENLVARATGRYVKLTTGQLQQWRAAAPK
jgi:hypothetical protein